MAGLSTVGIFGGGQLGRMSILAGRRLGLRFVVFDARADSTAARVADESVVASFEDGAAVERFAKMVDVITVEFENVPVSALELASNLAPTRPSAHVLGVAQNRKAEKNFLRDHGYPCAPFALVDTRAELDAAMALLGVPAVLKTADFGYDGKGQVKLDDDKPATLDAAFVRLGSGSAVLERWIQHRCEISVICARSLNGSKVCFPIAENVHRHHILHQSIVPARIEPEIAANAIGMAEAIADSLEVVGLIAVEMFVTKEGDILVNEIAPRPHNSGHYSLDACLTSQFEQHVRAVIGWPLGATNLLSPAVMVNLLGDLWQGGEPNWQALLAEPSVKLHLYDKGTPAAGRKMGHYTVLDSDQAAALARAERLYERLSSR